jgi:hypothetical protein
VTPGAQEIELPSTILPLRDPVAARDGSDREAPAPAATPRAPLRVAPRADGRAPSDAFWRDYHRRRSMNHVALMLTARAVQAALDAGEPVDDGTRRRLRAALDDYESVQRSLRERVGDLHG